MKYKLVISCTQNNLSRKSNQITRIKWSSYSYIEFQSNPDYVHDLAS